MPDDVPVQIRPVRGSLLPNGMGLMGFIRSIPLSRSDQKAMWERIDAKKDARYASMTPEQREAYYVTPNLWTRIKRWIQRD